jgi:hypothetical protein
LKYKNYILLFNSKEKYNLAKTLVDKNDDEALFLLADEIRKQ